MISIDKNIVNELVAYFSTKFPNEACGLLVSLNDISTIDQFISIPNISNMPKSEFNFEPSAYLKTLYELEKINRRSLGVIHSHPLTSAYPSNKDISNWYYQDLSYWIYSCLDNSLKAFYIKANLIDQVNFEIV